MNWIVGQGIDFEITPELFDRIEFWSIRRKQVGVHSERFGLQELLGLPTFVSVESIPDEYERSAMAAQEVLKKLDHTSAVD